MAVLHSDNFNRTVSGSWGTASDGHNYIVDGTAYTLAVDGSLGTATGASTAGVYKHGTDTVGDVDVQVDFQLSSTAATLGVDARASDRFNGYRAIYNNGSFTLSSYVSSTGTTLGTAAFTLTINTTYSIRLLIVGSAVKAKIWLTSSGEPSTWNYEVTDTTWGSGQTGIRINLGNTARTAHIDNFTVKDGFIATVDNPRTISASAAFKVNDKTRTVTDSSPLLKTTAKTISSVTTALVPGVLTCTVLATVPLLATSSKTLSSTVSLAFTLTRSVSASSVLYSTATRSLVGTSALLATNEKTLLASWAVLATKTRVATTQSGALLFASTRATGATLATLATFSRQNTTGVATLATRTRNTSQALAVLQTQTRTLSNSKTAILQTQIRACASSLALYAYRAAASSVPLLKSLSCMAGASVSTSLAKARGLAASVSFDMLVTTRVIPTHAPFSQWQWQYKKSITILGTQVAGAASDFPLFVQMVDPDLRTVDNGGKMGESHGYDIAFYDSSELVLLDYELENYNPVTGEIAAWVRVPSLSGITDTLLYLYFGNTAITTSQQNKTGVWGGCNAIWHMAENPTGGQTSDSSSNTNTLTVIGTWGNNVAGKTGMAYNFNGTDDTLQRNSNATLLPSSSLTLSFWVSLNQRPSIAGHDYMVVQKAHSASPWYSYQVYISAIDNTVRGSWDNSVGTDTWVIGTTQLQINTWYHIALVKTATTLKIYINGVDDTSSSSVPSGTLLQSDGLLHIGGITAKYVNALLDEGRIIPSARSANWLLTEYRNQNNPGTFYQVGPLVYLQEAKRQVSGSAALLGTSTHNMGATISLSTGILRQMTGSVAIRKTSARICTGTSSSIASGSVSTKTRVVTTTGCLHYQISTSPYGVTHFIEFNRPFLLPQRDIDDLVGNNCLGFGEKPILRYQITWEHCEPIQQTPAVYDWTNLDDAIPRCNAAGIAVWIQLSRPPLWYCSLDINGATVPLGDATALYATYDKWTPYVNAITTRYNGRHGHGFVDFWQIENEEYDLNGSYAQRNAHAYLIPPVVNACYPIIKANSPDSLVVLPAMRGTDAANEKKHFDSWLGYVAANCGTNYDGMDYHYYVNAVQNSEPNVMDGSYMTITQRLQYLRNILNPYRPDRPFICMGEFGWPMYDDGTGTNILRDPVTNGNWICEVFDAFQAVEPTGKALIFTMRQNSTVDTSVTPNTATAVRSLVQTINNTYTHTQAYTIVANYIQSNPSWIETGRVVPISIVTRKTSTRGMNTSGALGYTVGVTLHSDDFNRVVASGLGVASDGESYTLSGSTATWSVNGANASCTGIASGASYARHGNATLADIDIQLDFRMSTSAPTVGIYFRGTSTDCYHASVSNQVFQICRIATNISSTLVSQSYPITANTWYTLRVLAVGGNIFSKVWQTGQGEPSSWGITVYDEMYLSGPFGIRVTAGNIARVMDVDNFIIRNADYTSLPAMINRQATVKAAVLTTTARTLITQTSIKGEGAENIFALTSLAYIGLMRLSTANGAFFSEKGRNITVQMACGQSKTHTIFLSSSLSSYRSLVLSSSFLSSPTRDMSETAAIGAYAARVCLVQSSLLQTSRCFCNETVATLVSNQRYIGVYASVYVQRVVSEGASFLKTATRTPLLTVSLLQVLSRSSGQSVATRAVKQRGVTGACSCSITQVRSATACAVAITGTYQRSFILDASTVILSQSISVSMATVLYGKKILLGSMALSGTRQRNVIQSSALFTYGSSVITNTWAGSSTRQKQLPASVSLVTLRSMVALVPLLQSGVRQSATSSALSLVGVFAHNMLASVSILAHAQCIIASTGATGLLAQQRAWQQSVAIQKAGVRTTVSTGAFLATCGRGVALSLASQQTAQQHIAVSEGFSLQTILFLQNSMTVQITQSCPVLLRFSTQQEENKSILVTGSVSTANVCQQRVFSALSTTQETVFPFTFAGSWSEQKSIGSTAAYLLERKCVLANSFSATLPITGIGRNVQANACLLAHSQKHVLCSVSVLLSNAVVFVTHGNACTSIQSGHAFIHGS